MILNGLLLTHIQHNGRMLLKVMFTAIVLVSLLNACSVDWWVGDGRGDWTVDLYEGYGISKINSNEILLIHKENPNDSGGSIIISNFFVAAYQLQEPYIYLEGIHTNGIAASDAELNNMVLNYYLVDTTDGEVIGPFESRDTFIEHCSSLRSEIKDEWIKTTE